MVIFFYGFCRMDKVYTYSVHWGGIVHIQERANYPQWMGNLPILQIYPILQNSSMLQIHPRYNSPTPQFAYIAPLKLEGEARAKGVMSRFPDGEHRKGGRGIWYSFFYGLGLFSFS